MKSLLVRLLAISPAFWTINVPATVRYVNVNGFSPAPPYTSWATAATNIQDAVDAAVAGDQIFVTNGVYRAGSHIDLGVLTITNALTIQSVNGPESTIIDGQGVLRCAYLTGGTFLAGFTLTGGTNSGVAGGVLCQSSTAVISNSVITRNSSGTSSGGVRFGTVVNSIISSNSAPEHGGGSESCILKNCALIGNYAGEGGGDYYSSASNCTFVANQAVWGGGSYGSTLVNCTLWSNSASIDGGGMYWGSAQGSIIESNSAAGAGGGSYQSTLRACAISRNSASSGGGAYLASVYNCTITANSASAGGGVEDGSLQNSIVYYNSAPIGANYDGASVSLSYCCTLPLPSGTGNITNEPALASSSHLSTSSPCQGKGSATYAQGRDLDGQLWAAPPSMGCDETGNTTGPITVAIVPAFTNAVTGTEIGFASQIIGRLSASWWEFGDGMVVSNRPFIAHACAGVGDYPVVLHAYNDTYPLGITATVTIHLAPQSVHYVSLQSTSPVPPFSSWTTAATNLQDAIDAATLPGELVMVSNGVYVAGERIVSSQTNRLVVDKPMRLRSVNGPAYTTIRGSGSPYLSGPVVRCVYLGAGASLAGFTLADGAAVGSGGGVWCASANSLVADCILSNNACGDAGGAVFWGTVSNCTLVKNTAHSGGGAARSTMLGCLLSDNVATLGGAAHYCSVDRSVLSNNVAASYGGGIYGGSMSRSTVAGNSAGYGGGGAYVSTLFACLLTNNYTDWNGAGISGGTLESCVLVGNNAASYGGGAAGGTLNNCTLTGNSAGYRGGGTYLVTLNNCIVYSNAAVAGSPNYTNSTLNNCCTTPQPDSGTGNVTSPPLFVNQAGGNFRLQTNSPCINAGDNSYAASSTDLDGRPRLVGSHVDIGAYEFQAAGMGEFIGWLQQYGLPVDGTVDYADSDGDGFNNWQEWRIGTSPTDRSSLLKMTTVTHNVSGSMVTWQSVSGITYLLQCSTNLGAQPAFSTIQTGIAGQPNTTSYADITATNGGPYFYRVGVQ